MHVMLRSAMAFRPAAAAVRRWSAAGAPDGSLAFSSTAETGAPDAAKPGATSPQGAVGEATRELARQGTSSRQSGQRPSSYPTKVGAAQGTSGFGHSKPSLTQPKPDPPDEDAPEIEEAANPLDPGELQKLKDAAAAQEEGDQVEATEKKKKTGKESAGTACERIEGVPEAEEQQEAEVETTSPGSESDWVKGDAPSTNPDAAYGPAEAGRRTSKGAATDDEMERGVENHRVGGYST